MCRYHELVFADGYIYTFYFNSRCSLVRGLANVEKPTKRFSKVWSLCIEGTYLIFGISVKGLKFIFAEFLVQQETMLSIWHKGADYIIKTRTAPYFSHGCAISRPIHVVSRFRWQSKQLILNCLEALFEPFSEKILFRVLQRHTCVL